MSYLTFKIISIIVMIVIMVIVIAVRRNSKNQNMENEKTPDVTEITGNEVEDEINYRAVHNDIYFVEYKLIPQLVEVLKDQPDNALETVSNMYKNLLALQDHLRVIHPTAFGEVTCEIRGNIEEECLVVFEFPKPYEMPLAKYGAIYINKEKNAYPYLTLEFSVGGWFVLGSMTQERHTNYGSREDMSKDVFIHEVCLILGVDESTLRPTKFLVTY